MSAGTRAATSLQQTAVHTARSGFSLAAPSHTFPSRPRHALRKSLRAAAAAPSCQRQLLRDALQRTLEANELRMPQRGVHAILCLPQPEILAALELGPLTAGCAAEELRLAGQAPARRRGLRK